MATELSDRRRPRWRGLSHGLAFVASLVTGPLLIADAVQSVALGPVALYALATSALFATSALLHVVTWQRRQYRRMQQLDRIVIYLFVSASFLVVFSLAHPDRLRLLLLLLVWLGAAAGILISLAWPEAPKWASAAAYVFLGWLALPAGPGLIAELGTAPVALLLGGGLSFTAGALTYALRRPDPFPEVFGYHELFHLLVIAGVAAHHVAIGRFLLPAALITQTAAPWP